MNWRENGLINPEKTSRLFVDENIIFVIFEPDLSVKLLEPRYPGDLNSIEVVLV